MLDSIRLYQAIDIIELYQTLLDCIGLFWTIWDYIWILLNCIKLHGTGLLFQTLLDCIRLNWTVSDSIRLHHTLLDCIKLYRLELDSVGLYPALLG